MIISPLNELIEGVRLNPLFAAGLMILAVVLIALVVDGTRGQQ